MQEEYDPWNEIPNEDKIRNCYSLSRVLLVVFPLLSVILYLLKSTVVEAGLLSAEQAQTIIGGAVILTVFLCLAILFTLMYLRRKLRDEERNPKDN